jgi:hypothetical protein
MKYVSRTPFSGSITEVPFSITVLAAIVVSGSDVARVHQLLRLYQRKLPAQRFLIYIFIQTTFIIFSREIIKTIIK